MIDRRRAALGLSLIAAGALWIFTSLPSLAWFGFTPIGLYRSVDQPPILLALVGLWYSARGRRQLRARSEAAADPLARRRSAAEAERRGGEDR